MRGSAVSPCPRAAGMEPCQPFLRHGVPLEAAMPWEAAFWGGSAAGLTPSWGCRGPEGGRESCHLELGRLSTPRRGWVGPKGLPGTGVDFSGFPLARGKAELSRAHGPALGHPVAWRRGA